MFRNGIIGEQIFKLLDGGILTLSTYARVIFIVFITTNEDNTGVLSINNFSVGR